MYKIMLVAAKRDDITKNLYKYMLDGKKVYQTDNKQDLDKKVEEMLNGDYAKSDFIIVEELEYNVISDIMDNNEYTEEETPNPDVVEPENPDTPDEPNVEPDNGENTEPDNNGDNETGGEGDNTGDSNTESGGSDDTGGDTNEDNENNDSGNSGEDDNINTEPNPEENTDPETGDEEVIT